MSRRKIACPASIALTCTEVAALEVIKHGHHKIDEVLWCELEPGHEGLHHALGQTAGDSERSSDYWLRWDDQGERRDITVLDGCTALEDPSDPEGHHSDMCVLPAGHAGSHSFSFFEFHSLPQQRQ